MPLGSRGAAERLSRRLEAGVPVTDDRTLVLALRLQATGASLSSAVLPRPDFRAALRTRVVAVATVQAHTASTPAETVNARHAAVSWRAAERAPRASWRAVAAAGVLASVTAVAGVAAAGSQSLPGEPFYGVKTAAEAVQLRLAGDDVATGTLHLELAATRLREVRALSLGREADLGVGGSPVGSDPLALAGRALSADREDRVRETLAAMDEQTREGTTLLTGAWRSTRATEPLRTLARFADRQRVGLADLLPSLPSGSRAQAQVSLDLVNGVAEQAGGLLAVGSCTSACDPRAAAPLPPGAPGATSGPAEPARPDCTCPSPAPAPSVPAGPPGPAETPAPTGTAPPASERPTPDDPDAEGTPPASPGPSPSDSPSPSPSDGGLPGPVPTLPLPLPTLTPLLTPLLTPGGLPTDAVGVEGVLGGLLDPLTP